SHWRLADDRNVLYLSPTGETDTEKTVELSPEQDYAFSRIWITYEYIDKTIRSAIITLIYNMANLSFRAPGA
ncbi:hypothetical protein A3219_19740, partial [Salmonella enterica]